MPWRPTVPPLGLGVGGHSHGTADVSYIPVTALNGPMIEAGRKIENDLAVCCIHYAADIAGNFGATGQDAQVDCFQVGKQAGDAGDMHHRLPGGDAGTVIERFNFEIFEAALLKSIQFYGVQTFRVRRSGFIVSLDTVQRIPIILADQMLAR
jgi:hypothetical protein